MSNFHFVTLGVGNAFSALYYSTALALQAEGAWLLIDCPHPIRKILRESSRSAGLSLDVENFLAVVLTHLHGDHASGLEGYGYYRHYALQGEPAKIYTHPEVAAHLWQGHLAGGMEWSMPKPGEPAIRRRFEDYFDLRYLHEKDAVEAGPFTIECHKTIHSVPTIALRIRAAGRTLGYSADTAFDRGLIDWLAEADLIIHETGQGGLHTPYEDLLALPENIRSKLRLIHYADDFDAQNSAIEPLQQGRQYPV